MLFQISRWSFHQARLSRPRFQAPGRQKALAVPAAAQVKWSTENDSGCNPLDAAIESLHIRHGPQKTHAVRHLTDALNILIATPGAGNKQLGLQG